MSDDDACRACGADDAEALATGEGSKKLRIQMIDDT
jgi:hypothetical protein